jgi:TonB family protein
VLKAYYASWNPPLRIRLDGLVVRTVVTIARDGRVLSSHIIEPSGNLALDRSVQAALDSVHRVPAFRTNLTNQLDEVSIPIHFRVESRVESLDWPPKETGRPMVP